MQTTFTPTQPAWLFWTITCSGLAWNLFGIFQFANTALASEQGLIMGGMTAEQAALYFNLPFWMNAAFAVGVFGGVIGSALMLLRKRQALPVFALSLGGYIVLYIGDLTEGVFAAFGTPQVVILSIVVLIAVGLWLSARHYARSGVIA